MGSAVEVNQVRLPGHVGRAFRLNLSALSRLALICGAFLIYNTMTFSVVQRRTQIGILRARQVEALQLHTEQTHAQVLDVLKIPCRRDRLVAGGAERHELRWWETHLKPTTPTRTDAGR